MARGSRLVGLKTKALLYGRHLFKRWIDFLWIAVLANPRPETPSQPQGSEVRPGTGPHVALPAAVLRPSLGRTPPPTPGGVAWGCHMQAHQSPAAQRGPGTAGNPKQHSCVQTTLDFCLVGRRINYLARGISLPAPERGSASFTEPGLET